MNRNKYNTYAMFDGSLRMQIFEVEADGSVPLGALEMLKDERITTLELSSDDCNNWKPVLDIYNGRGYLSIYTNKFNFKLLEGYNNLEQLNIEVSSMKQGFDLSKLESLKYLNIRAGKSIEKINFCSKSLKALRLSYLSVENLKLFNALDVVEFLSIYRSTKLKTLDGIEHMNKLKNVWLVNNSNIQSIEALVELNNLVDLKLEENKRLVKYSPVSNIKKLDNLMIAGLTDSIGFLGNCNNLTQLSFGLKVGDGDLTPLKKLINLSYLDGRDRKGQSPSFNEIKSYLIENHQYSEMLKYIPDFDAYI